MLSVCLIGKALQNLMKYKKLLYLLQTHDSDFEMYKDFRIKNIKGFEDLHLKDTKRINLIAGKNNTGKTALLEALFIHSGYNPSLTARIDAFRGLSELRIELIGGLTTPWDALFNNFDRSKPIELLGNYQTFGRRRTRLEVVKNPQELARLTNALRGSVISSKSEDKQIPSSLEPIHVLKLECKENKQTNSYYMVLDMVGWRIHPIPPSIPYQAIFLPARRQPPSLVEDAERFGELEIKKQEHLVLKTLQSVEKRLKSVTVIAGRPKTPQSQSHAMIYGDIGIDHLLPLPLMGEGIVRLTSLILAIGNAQNGVVLVDEIENGFHHSVLADVWKAIDEAARRFNTQIFATTHSLDSVIAAHETFKRKKQYSFRLYRLERINELILAKSYSKKTLEAAIEIGLEVR